VTLNSCLKLLCSGAMLFFMLVTAQLGLFGCKDSTSQNTLPPTWKPIRIAAYTSEMAALVWIAEQKGFFKNQGLDVQITGFDSGIAAVNAIFEGTHDIATAADFVFARTVLENRTIKVMASIARSDSIEMLTHKGKGISTPIQLKGKKIGLTRKTPSEFFLNLHLLYNQIDPKSVTIVDLPPQQLVESFIKGDIDATITWEPNLWKIKQKLAGKVNSWSVQSDQQFYFLLIGNSTFIEKQPEATQKLLQALAQAEILVKKDPALAQKLLVQKLALEEPYMTSVWPKHVIGLSLDQPLLVILEDQARWIRSSGIIPPGKPLNFLEYIHRDALKAVSAKALTIVQ
jgi:ABC-type nitrate/sulfonate/bicarbonate transport system substrate-binding protein